MTKFISVEQEKEAYYKETEPQLVEKPKHLDFAYSVFNELSSFDVEEKVEILRIIYFKIENEYQYEVDMALKTADEYKGRLETLKMVEPKNK